MNHFDLKFSGSVLYDGFYPLLVSVRTILQSLKEQKLRSRHEKLKIIGRLDAETNITEVFNHLIEEVNELRVELENGSDLVTVLKECADIINCTEIIGARVMKEPTTF